MSERGVGGKLDMDRVGLFKELGYVTINDSYKSGRVQFNVSSSKGKQMLPGGNKMRSALQAGYFSDKFARVLEGEAFSDPIKLRRQLRLLEAQKNLGKAFVPSNGEKLMSGSGGYYGTLSGPIMSFSPITKPPKERKIESKNVLSNPGKKGTGFGYIGVTIGKYPPYQPDSFDTYRELVKKDLEEHISALKGGPFRLNMHPQAYFDGNPFNTENLPKHSASATSLTKKDEFKSFKPSSLGKKPGNCKAGTFDPYPMHSMDPYEVKISHPVNVVNNSGKTFVPSQGPKSTPMVSIVKQNVLRTVNTSNYKTRTRVTY